MIRRLSSMNETKMMFARQRHSAQTMSHSASPDDYLSESSSLTPRTLTPRNNYNLKNYTLKEDDEYSDSYPNRTADPDLQRRGGKEDDGLTGLRIDNIPTAFEITNLGNYSVLRCMSLL
jgi:hypothetical protein